MGDYYEVKTKEIKFKQATPMQITHFLNNVINGESLIYPKPDHPFFEKPTWQEMFGKWAWHDNPCTYFKWVNNFWRLFIHIDVRYRDYEIIASFIKWITPYVNGHKPKEYIGFMKDEEGRVTNLYITRN